jgi:hypothetical protein
MIASSKASRKRNQTSTKTRGGSRTISASSRYEVLDRAGEGTLFVVYRVRGREGESIRALKALKGAYSRHERFAPAVLDCAARLSGLSHPHLLCPLESGREEGTVFLVENWMPGGALESRLRRAPLGPLETRRLATQLAGGLEHLHAHGLAHGDVRPRQVLFDEEGAPRLDDIALVSAFDASGLSHTDAQLDAVLYCAPERFDGEPISPATDLYSLGVLLYRAIAGRAPFDGPSPLSIAMRHRNDRPLRPSQFNPSCTPELEAVILCLLEKEPDVRFASATALLDEIAPDRVTVISGAQGAATPTADAVTSSVVTPAIGAAGNNAAHFTLDREETTAPVTLDGSDAGESTPAPRVRPKPRPQVVPIVVADEDEDDFLSEEEKTRRARLEKKRFRRREFWGAVLAFFWMLVFAGLFCGVLYGAYSFWMKEAPLEIQVPRYVGLNERDAEVLLANWGLKLSVGKEIYNPKKPEGTVLGGSPSPGKHVRKGRVILVTVSRGEKPIRMVDFAELPLDQARAIITRHGLRLGQIAEQYHGRIPKGCVCGQYPEPGEMFRRSEPINLVISRGPQPSAVAPAPDALPIAPPTPAPPAAPRLGADDPSSRAPIPQPAPDTDEQVLVPRTAVVSVTLPSGAGPQEVKIVVRDATGDFTAYQQTHAPGDLVEKTIQVVRPQSGTALIRIYVGGKLLREIRV